MGSEGIMEELNIEDGDSASLKEEKTKKPFQKTLKDDLNEILSQLEDPMLKIEQT